MIDICVTGIVSILRKQYLIFVLAVPKKADIINEAGTDDGRYRKEWPATLMEKYFIQGFASQMKPVTKGKELVLSNPNNSRLYISFN